MDEACEGHFSGGRRRLLCRHHTLRYLPYHLISITLYNIKEILSI